MKRPHPTQKSLSARRISPRSGGSPVWGCLLLALACTDKDEPVTTRPQQSGQRDSDGDGYEADVDCDDSNPAVHPGATEHCDDTDADCDGDIGREDPDAVDAQVIYEDADGDGYGDATRSSVACEVPEGYSADGTDCDDAHAAASPEGIEVCDTLDNDCDGLTDETDPGMKDGHWYPDADGDGYGDPDTEEVTCDTPPAGYVSNDLDCDDADPALNPDAAEVCDHVDQDCNREVDDGLGTACERCEDGGDDDLDGLVDCEDGDCWDSPLCPLTTRAWPTDGQITVTHAATDTSSWIASRRVSGRAISGQVQRILGQQLVSTCTWTVDELQATFSSWATSAGSAWARTPATRRGAAFDRDCELDTWGFLPPYLFADGSAVHLSPYGSWPLTSTWSASLAFPRSGEHPWYHGSLFREQSRPQSTSWVIRPLESGSPYADCDLTDSALNQSPLLTWYPDNDADGLGDRSSPTDACVEPEGLPWVVSNGDDCDDDDSAVGDSDGPLGADTSMHCVPAAFIGEAETDFTGASLTDAGDINDDGRDDLVLTAYGSERAGTDAGAVFVVSGAAVSTGTTSISAAWSVLLGEAESDYAGWSVSGGDIDTDGHADLLIGAYGVDTTGTEAGAAYLVWGDDLTGGEQSVGDGLKLTGEAAQDYAGGAVAVVGDVDDDGWPDVVVGAYGNDSGGTYSGRAYLLSGQGLDGRADTMSLADADATLTGEATYDNAAYALDGAGDLDGDGIGDLLIGAPKSDSADSDAGQVHILRGGSLTGALSLADDDWGLLGDESYIQAGDAVAGVGDVDGDGLGDVLVGVPDSDAGGTDGGEAVLVLASSLPRWGGDITLAGPRVVGAKADQVGAAVAGAGDLDSDGRSDLLIGAPGHTTHDGAVGKAVVLLASEITSDATWALADLRVGIIGDARGEQAGAALAGVGDVDGDGRRDVVVGASRNNDGGRDAGKTVLFSVD